MALGFSGLLGRRGFSAAAARVPSFDFLRGGAPFSPTHRGCFRPIHMGRDSGPRKSIPQNSSPILGRFSRLTTIQALTPFDRAYGPGPGGIEPDALIAASQSLPPCDAWGSRNRCPKFRYRVGKPDLPCTLRRRGAVQGRPSAGHPGAPSRPLAERRVSEAPTLLPCLALRRGAG